jgi:hypothetical protein
VIHICHGSTSLNNFFIVFFCSWIGKLNYTPTISAFEQLADDEISIDAGKKNNGTHFCFERLDSRIVLFDARLPLPRRHHGTSGAIERVFELCFSNVPVATAEAVGVADVSSFDIAGCPWLAGTRVFVGTRTHKSGGGIKEEE